jgi:hypothetical protein
VKIRVRLVVKTADDADVYRDIGRIPEVYRKNQNLSCGACLGIILACNSTWLWRPDRFQW